MPTEIDPDMAREARQDHAADLVRAVADFRDRRAFEQLYRHFAPRLKAYGLKLGADRAVAEELAQEAMLTLWRKAASFDPAKASVSTWLFAIARNRRIDLLRRHARPLPSADELLPLIEPGPRADDGALAREDGIGQPLKALCWRRVAPGVREHKLPLDDGRHKAVLLAIAPGQTVPRHSHRGQELTLVLEGGYRDGGLDFARGDLQVADDAVDHRPVADPDEGCICLVEYHSRAGETS